MDSIDDVTRRMRYFWQKLCQHRSQTQANGLSTLNQAAYLALLNDGAKGKRSIDPPTLNDDPAAVVSNLDDLAVLAAKLRPALHSEGLVHLALKLEPIVDAVIYATDEDDRPTLRMRWLWSLAQVLAEREMHHRPQVGRQLRQLFRPQPTPR